MTTEDKLEKIKKLADDMYYAAANLGPNVGSGERLRKTMDEYRQFIINEYHKEEPVSEDLEQAINTYLATYFGGEKEKQEWPFIKKMVIHFAEWQKEQDKQWLAEEYKHIFAQGRDSMKQQILDSNTTLQRTFELGKQEMKQQMMKEAVNGTFSFGELADGTPIDSIFVLDKEARSKYKVGDKVKLLIIKEE